MKTITETSQKQKNMRIMSVSCCIWLSCCYLKYWIKKLIVMESLANNKKYHIRQRIDYQLESQYVWHHSHWFEQQFAYLIEYRLFVTKTKQHM